MDLTEKLFLDTYPSVGQNQTALAKYHLNLATVIKAAESMQERTQTFRPRSIHGLETLFNSLIENPVEDTTSALTYFNVPVCDLDLIDGLDADDWLTDESYDRRTVPEILTFISYWNCRKLKIGSSSWPFTQDDSL